MGSLSQYVVAYDATRDTSERHIVRRGTRRPACGVTLMPWGRFKTIDGLPTSRETPGADCPGCLVVRARALAIEAHGNQPGHIGHVQQVVRAVDQLAESPLANTTAWLHDVLHDSSWTIQGLRAEHFPPVVLSALDLLDQEGVPYEDKIERILTAEGRHGKIARVVCLVEAQIELAMMQPSDVVRDPDRRRRLRVTAAALSVFTQADLA